MGHWRGAVKAGVKGDTYHSIDVQGVCVTLAVMMNAGKAIALKPIMAGLAGTALFAGCTPTVKVEAPQEPITINLNVKIDQEVRIRLDEEVENLIAENPDLF